MSRLGLKVLLPYSLLNETTAKKKAPSNASIKSAKKKSNFDPLIFQNLFTIIFSNYLESQHFLPLLWKATSPPLYLWTFLD